MSPPTFTRNSLYLWLVAALLGTLAWRCDPRMQAVPAAERPAPPPNRDTAQGVQEFEMLPTPTPPGAGTVSE